MNLKLYTMIQEDLAFKIFKFKKRVKKFLKNFGIEPLEKKFNIKYLKKF